MSNESVLDVCIQRCTAVVYLVTNGWMRRLTRVELTRFPSTHSVNCDVPVTASSLSATTFASASLMELPRGSLKSGHRASVNDIIMPRHIKAIIMHDFQSALAKS